MAPWYLTPEALPILASLRADPPRIEHCSDVYVLTRDDWSRYTGARVDRLTAIYSAELERLSAVEPFPDSEARALIEQGSPQDVIAAVLGQWLPGIHFVSDTARLARIRADVDAALAVKAAA